MASYEREKMMQTEKRWLKSVLKEATVTEVKMPWARGARRGEMIARRRALSEQTKSARA
ncbi:hypothetical protein [Pseudohalocynthiibacter sp. F2068]|jgi:hypothetical protein|nr:hypothetical protein [Pseudohalocynthiibacter sp. F2068]